MKSDPWYANIVNFMVAGYVPLGRTKESLSTKVISTYGMNRTSLESALTTFLEGVYR